MEHALGELIVTTVIKPNLRLNPYCNGTCSRSMKKVSKLIIS